MAFQFLCPQGHALEVDDRHIGMQTQCPECRMIFKVPDPKAAVEEPQAKAGAAQGVGRQAVGGGLDDLLDELHSGGGGFDAGGENLSSGVIHIPCPNGHELETPLDMIGHEALCPWCGVQFRLKKEQSLEHRRQQSIIDAKRARIWFKISIGAAGLVFVALLIMLIVTIAR